jgi:hypothetical protein
MAQHPSRQSSSYSMSRKPEISHVSLLHDLRVYTLVLKYEAGVRAKGAWSEMAISPVDFFPHTSVGATPQPAIWPATGSASQQWKQTLPRQRKKENM